MRRFILATVTTLLAATLPAAAGPPAPGSFEITGHKGMVIFVGFSADSKVLTTVDEGGLVRRWDARTGKKTVRPDGQFAASPDGKTVLTLVPGGRERYGLLTAWDATTGARLRQLRGDWLPLLPESGRGGTFVLSPDGCRVAAVEVALTLDFCYRAGALPQDDVTHHRRHSMPTPISPRTRTELEPRARKRRPKPYPPHTTQRTSPKIAPPLSLNLWEVPFRQTQVD